MLNLNHLRAFYSCALHQNVTLAAEELQVSQPSVSQQIKAFESELGIELFYRNGRNLELTSHGKNLFLKSQLIFESLVGVEEFVGNRPEISGNINFGVSNEIERPFIAKITAELIKCSIFKNASFKVYSMNEFDMKDQIRKNQCHVLLAHSAQPHSSISTEFTFPVKLLSKKQNIEISQAKQNNVKSLLSALGQKLILPSHELKLRKELEENISIKDLSNFVLMESNILSCLTEGIREGAGCGFLPIQYAYEDVKKSRLSVYGPANGFWSHKIYLSCHNSGSESVYAEIKRIIQRFKVEKGG